jgi:hypothetical protein
MKKFIWVLAFMAAALILFSGCESESGPGPGPGPDNGNGDGDEPGESTLAGIFSATPSQQSKATVTNFGETTVTFSFTGEELWGELITPEEARWDASAYTGIKFEYKSTGNATIFAQDTNTIFIYVTEGEGWGAIAEMSDWQELELPFSILENLGWFNDGDAPFDKSAIIKFCFQISNSGPNNKKFEIRNFTAY